MQQKPLSYETLKSQVSALANTNTAVTEQQPTSYMDYMKPPYTFGIVLIVIAMILYYMQPFFVMDDDPKYEPGQGMKLLSYKKVMIFSVVITGILAGCYYYYYGKMQPVHQE